MNKPEEALRELQVAVSLESRFEIAHHLLGTAVFQQQQLHAAEKEFREALRLNASADNHFSLAACLMSLDRYRKHCRNWKSASRLDPDATCIGRAAKSLLKLMKDPNARSE